VISTPHCDSGSENSASKCKWFQQRYRASKRTRNTLPYGTLKVRVGRGSVEWFTKLMVWLELAQQM